MKLVASIGALLLTAGAAAAADLPMSKAPLPLPPVFTWTGPSLGLLGGYTWGSNKPEYGKETFSSFDTRFPNAPSVNGYSLSNTTVHRYSNNGGPILGGALGYDYQVSRSALIGVQADMSWMGQKQTDTYTSVNNIYYATVPDPSQIGTETTEGRTSVRRDWLGTARLRAGFIADRALIYATGGLAFGGVKASSMTTYSEDYVDPYVGQHPNFAGTVSGSGSKTMLGFAVGGGIQYALTPHWLVGAEYIYYNLGTLKYSVSGTISNGNGALDNTVQLTNKVKIDGNIVRGGVSYKF